MSSDLVQDIADMHQKFGVNEWVSKKLAENDTEALMSFLKFRLDFIKEEFDETTKAVVEDKDPEEIVDGLIDIIVVALGTLDAFNVDTVKAWNEVHTANMSKNPGVKPERPNPLGLPDLIKPADWKGPSHEGNHGDLPIVVK